MAYVPPTASDLKARYPAFTGVDDATINYWLTDAQRFADDSWPIEGDIPPAQIAMAAHNMITAGVAGIGDGDISALLAAGVTGFQSGGREGFRVSLSDEAIRQALSGGYEASKPGQEYLRLLRRNKGFGVSAPGHLPCYDYFPGYPYGFVR